MKHLSKHFYLINFIILISLSFKLKIMNSMPVLKLDKQDSAINLDSSLLSILSFGQNRLISDFLWITTLLESDQTHYKAKDNNSWMYLRFKSISDLDPLFLKNYQFGSQYLSIIKDDISSAEILFKKGLSYYPKDYNLNLNYGFLLAFEKHDYKAAIGPYEVMLNLPSPPPFLYSLIPKLKFMTTNSLEITFEALSATYENLTEETLLKEKIYNDLYSIKAEIDLKCLNNGDKNCSFVDFDNLPYVKNKRIYTAPKKFKKYKIFKH